MNKLNLKQQLINKEMTNKINYILKQKIDKIEINKFHIHLINIIQNKMDYLFVIELLWIQDQISIQKLHKRMTVKINLKVNINIQVSRQILNGQNTKECILKCQVIKTTNKKKLIYFKKNKYKTREIY